MLHYAKHPSQDFSRRYTVLEGTTTGDMKSGTEDLATYGAIIPSEVDRDRIVERFVIAFTILPRSRYSYIETLANDRADFKPFD